MDQIPKGNSQELSLKDTKWYARAHLTMLQCHYHHQRVINVQTSHEDPQNNTGCHI